jgi:peptidoglycan/xylan/chitin deacetylase (PgdA/CDA1 family)
MVAIPAFSAGFFAAYFQLLNHPVFPVTLMPYSVVDRLIDFHPAAIVPYASLWFYVFLAPAFLRGRREIFAYGAAVTTLAAAGLGVFLFWPTAIPRPEIDWTRYPVVEFLKEVDATGNACPSLHVAFAVLTAVWLEHLLRQTAAPVGVRLLNVAWSAGILYSTLATKQHVAVDVLAGTTLGLAGALLYPRQPTNHPEPPPHPVFNRQSLALAVSVSAKLTFLALGWKTVHPAMAAVLIFGPDLWILRGLLIPNATELMPVVTRFATSRREVWLTIDDGPEPATTRPMLDLLDRHGARATFFLIGAKVAAEPGLAREILRRGHTLGNHTFTHPLATFWLAGPRRTAREIDSSQAAWQAAGAEPSVWFRAPAGIKTLFLRRALARRQMVLVGWTARGREHFSTSPLGPLQRLKKAIRPGAILLVHESAGRGAQRIALLTAVLDHLSATGYTCVLPGRNELI